MQIVSISTGGILYALYKSSSNTEYPTICDYSLKKAYFTITPSSTSITCNSTAPETFTVNNVNNSVGTLTYNWQVGSGWLYNGSPASNFTTNTNSIQLTPNAYPPSNVKVTPVLDGVSYPQLTSTISLASYNPSYSINGTDALCTVNTATYSVDNLPNGTTISSWSSSNTSVATISAINNHQATLTKQGDGSVTISAIVENSCGQQKTITKQIWTGGTPKITVQLVPQGSNSVMVNLIGTNNTDINTQGITATTWQKVSSSGGCYASFGGSGFEGLAQGNCNNWSVEAKITATNSCGTTTIYKTITPPPPAPCNNSFSFSQNPMKAGMSINKIIIDPCLTNSTKNSMAKINNYTISIYNKYGERVYLKTQKDTEFLIQNLKKGFYIVRFTTNKGNIISKKLIVE